MAFNNNSYFHYIKITTGSSEYYEHLEHCCKIVNNYINTQVEFVNACGISLFLRHWIWIWTESASEKTKLPFERRCRYVYYCPLLPIYIHTGTHSWALRFFVEVQHVESQKFQNSNCRLQFEDINNFPNLNWLHTWPRPDTCGGHLTLAGGCQEGVRWILHIRYFSAFWLSTFLSSTFKRGAHSCHKWRKAIKANGIKKHFSKISSIGQFCFQR
jgi:hypothetical protein